MLNPNFNSTSISSLVINPTILFRVDSENYKQIQTNVDFQNHPNVGLIKLFQPSIFCSGENNKIETAVTHKSLKKDSTVKNSVGVKNFPKTRR